MPNEKPRKRAESIAVENVKRIADMLRTERNEALALAQIKRQQADIFRSHLERAQTIIEGAIPSLQGNELVEANAFLAEIENELNAAE